jgi:hypothetical protein
MTKKINVTTTPYEGEDFPEAVHYPSYVADQLADRYGVDVDVSVGPQTRVYAYGYEPQGNTDLEDEIKHLVQVSLWEDFCAEGHKAYTLAERVAVSPCEYCGSTGWTQGSDGKIVRGCCRENGDNRVHTVTVVR